MELVSAAAFKFRKPSVSLHESKEFLDSVFKSLKHLEELNFSSVSKFTLDFPFRQQLGTSTVASLIHQALQFKIEKLKLILTNGDFNECLSDSDDSSTFDMCLEPIKWNNLTDLKLSHMCLDKIDMIAEGCPVLKKLKLCDCWGFSSLYFDDHKNLNLLMLDGVWSKTGKKGKYITISAPTVTELVLLGNFNSRHVYFRDISSCSRAVIGFHLTSGDHQSALS